MTESSPDFSDLPLVASLEALLFVASGPVTILQLATGLGRTQEEIDTGLHQLEEQYKDQGGLRVQRHGNRVQLTTAGQFSKLIESFMGLQSTSKLSRAALESLAIIAYQQPITRPQIDYIRGVNSDGVIKSLLSKGLIEEQGRADAPGRPIIYVTTADFLQYFGINSIRELPPLESETSDQVKEVQERIFKD